jgi:hypothetical protein
MDPKRIEQVKTVASYFMNAVNMNGGGDGTEEEFGPKQELAAIGAVMNATAIGLEKELEQKKNSTWQRFKESIYRPVDIFDLYELEVVSRGKCLLKYVSLIHEYIEKKIDTEERTDPLVRNTLKMMFKYIILMDEIQSEMFKNKLTTNRIVSDCISYGNSDVNFRTICKIRYFIRYFDICKKDFEQKHLNNLIAKAKKLQEAMVSKSGGARRVVKRIVLTKLTLKDLKKLATERKVPGRSKLVTKDDFVVALRSHKRKPEKHMKRR